jgi:hypothetical protein
MPIAQQRRPQYPNKRPHRSAAAISAAGHFQTLALQKDNPFALAVSA